MNVVGVLSASMRRTNGDNGHVADDGELLNDGHEHGVTWER